MNRYRLGPVLGLVVIGACSLVAGCELTHHEQRSKAGDAISSSESDSDSDSAKEASGGVASKPPSGFFDGGRVSGGWSSEARSIERNLGVP